MAPRAILLVACLACHALQAIGLKLSTSESRGAANTTPGQWVNWVFVTDCSAYMYNQGNIMLASALYVNQPGEFTWLAYGCDRPEQKKQMQLLAHPRAKVWHVEPQELKHPRTGKTYPPFQASNRPLALLDWWRKAKPQEEAIGIIDPDETWMRPVHLVADPKPTAEQHSGPWETHMVTPKMASAAMYGIGCVFSRPAVKAILPDICGDNADCLKMGDDVSHSDCDASYASGPPWVLHRSDANAVLTSFVDNAILIHEAWPDMLAEQGSYGITQAMHGVKSFLDPYWFLSDTDPAQPWSALLEVNYDPCESREPPPTDLAIPPLWHACSTWEIPHLKGQGFRLHKDHVHKDLLDCGAPLVHYPPRDALKRYVQKGVGAHLMQTNQMSEFQSTWSVCAYTNLINTHAAAYKKRFCESPNLEPSASYPGGAQGFLDEQSPMKQIFRKGGWTDVNYKTGRSFLQTHL